nr:hypothetical protein [Clostridiales bacterium]
RTSSVPAGMTSVVALQLLIEQDDTRLSVTAEHVRDAVREMARILLRLYKQFARRPRLARFVGSEGDVELIRFTASDIGCDDVVFETENELSSTPAQRQSMLFDLLKMGLLGDENGKLDTVTRARILEAVGYGNWESVRDTDSMQIAAARRENNECMKGELSVREIDDDTLHEEEHVRFMLSNEFKKLCEQDATLDARMLEHVRAHRAQKRTKEEAEREGKSN